MLGFASKEKFYFTEEKREQSEQEMFMKRYIAIVTVAFILVSSTAAAKNPPLGKRKYLVDKEKHFSTVVIIPIADPSKGEYLREG